MNCAICENPVEQLAKTFDGEGFRCVTCGEYGISGTLLGSERWEALGSGQRHQALASAKKQAEPGKLPKITSYTF
jgi:hypothetical protein